MCIRDRRLLGWRIVPTDAKKADIGPTALAAEPAIEQLFIACLLYTSDAADERSSVDLGGRRIIKKKKTQYNDSQIASQATTPTVLMSR